jgi:uncharacterized protein (TIGR02246 family)
MTRKSLALAVLVSSVLALGVPVQGEDARKAPAKVSGSQAVDEAWTKAILANDLDAVVACYAPDAVMWTPGDPESKGGKAIREAYTALLKENTVKEAKLSETHYRTVGKTSVGWGHFSLTLAPKAGGAPVTMTGRFTDVAVENDGKWVYIADHASAEPPPKAPAPPANKK